MHQKRPWLNWIDQSNSKQCQWAIDYLVRKKVCQPQTGILADQLKLIVRDWPARGPGAEPFTLLEKQMRNAWAKVVARQSETSRKGYSFQMSKDVEQQLRRLAGNNPIAETLEALIKDTNAYKQRLEAQKREELAKLKQNHSFDSIATRQAQKITASKQLIREWQAATDTLLTVGARYRVALKAAGVLTGNKRLILEPEQEIAANKLYLRWKDALTKSVKANTSIARLFLEQNEAEQQQ